MIAADLARAGLDFIVPDWPVDSRVQGFVTTRNAADGTPFDVGGHGTQDATVLANRRRLQTLLPSAPVWLHQVHGATVVRLDGPARDASWPEADAAVTAVPRVVCSVRIADCMPVLLADRAGRAVGVAHAGWRGLAAGVLEATVAALSELGAQDVVAWLGPAIGPAAFEVGDDVRDAFTAKDAIAAAHFAPHGRSKWLADLYGLARERLAACGVHSMHGGGRCTYSEAAHFFSYRRDRDARRMAAFVWREGVMERSV
jgi:YfiH family protein